MMLNRSAIQNTQWFLACHTVKLLAKQLQREKKKKKQSTIIRCWCARWVYGQFFSVTLTLLCSQTNFSRISRQHRFPYSFWKSTKIQATDSVAVHILGLMREENNWQGSLSQASILMPEAQQPLIFAQAVCGARCTCEPLWFVWSVQSLESLNLLSYCMHNSKSPFPTLSGFWGKSSKIFTFSLTYAVNCLSIIKLKTAEQ